MTRLPMIALVMIIVAVFLNGCATTVRVVPRTTTVTTTVTEDVNNDGINEVYTYVDGVAQITITDPYDYYFYDGGVVYHYDYYNPQRVIVVDRPPMNVRIHRHRIPDHFYSSHPPTLWRNQRHENFLRSRPPQLDLPRPNGNGQHRDRNGSLPGGLRHERPSGSQGIPAPPPPRGLNRPQERHQAMPGSAVGVSPKPRFERPPNMRKGEIRRLVKPENNSSRVQNRHSNPAPQMNMPSGNRAPHVSAPSQRSNPSPRMNAPSSRSMGGGNRGHGGGQHRR